MKRLITSCLFSLLCSSACTPGPPELADQPDGGLANISYFADTVTVIGNGPDDVVDCFQGLPGCGSMSAPQPGPCTDNPALGPPDNAVFVVQALGRIDLAFLCSFIRETGSTTGGSTPDFVIHGTATAGAMPVVQVSEDGGVYQAVNLWPKNNGAYVDNPSFRLEVPALPYARFVRISETGGNGTISVDAVEALPILVGP